MIFVTVGHYNEGFYRLVRKMDEIARNIDEKVVMQIGFTDYKPLNSEYFKFEEYAKIQKLVSDSRIVVSHSGAGSILTAFEQKRHIIIVPRLKQLGEVVVDHQFEIATALSNNKNVTVITDVNDLESCLNLDFEFVENNDRNNGLVSSLKKYLSSIS